MIAACARVGTNAPNGGEAGSLSGVMRGVDMVKILSRARDGRADIADFANRSNDASSRHVPQAAAAHAAFGGPRR
jgi:hypothetical protein